MVDSKENYKCDLGVKGLKFDSGLIYCWERFNASHSKWLKRLNQSKVLKMHVIIFSFKNK